MTTPKVDTFHPEDFSRPSRVICMWSGPRNLSPAMMRSFGSRKDFTVWDEPFFSPFLFVTGKAHPGRDETLKRHETDPQAVARTCLEPVSTPYYFQKHMPHHMLPEFPRDWCRSATHFFLIRHPQRVIASYIKGRAEFKIEDLGFRAQVQLYNEISDLTTTRPPVINALDILKNPETALKTLCAAINIPFDPTMLSWASGPRIEDGAWAPYWYQSVENSTGFTAPPLSMPEIPPRYQAWLDACMEDYIRLKAVQLDV